MVGTLDSLLATALVIDDGERRVALTSVDHLGFTYEMCQKVQQQFDFDVVIGSTHTHAGGGAFLNVPVLGQMLAGAYSENTTSHYIEGAVQAIERALDTMQPAQIGVGLGWVKGVTHYRSNMPKLEPQDQLTLIKIVDAKGAPIAGLVNFALHPTVLDHTNLHFSADFVGVLREKLDYQLVYFNGAQAEIIPQKGLDRTAIADAIANVVDDLWESTLACKEAKVQCHRTPLRFTPQKTPAGVLFPVGEYQSEVGVLEVAGHRFALVPGELSVAYEIELQKRHGSLSILGLANDAHGYLIKPEAWDAKTMESHMSFGGRLHGERICALLDALLDQYHTKSGGR